MLRVQEEGTSNAMTSLARLVSDGAQEKQILKALAHSARKTLAAEAVAVLQTRGDRLVVSVVDGAPTLLGAEWDIEMIGPELGDCLQQLAQQEDLHAKVVPLVARGNLLGLLAVFRRDSQALADADLDPINGLADVAAAGLEQVSTADMLSSALDEVENSRRILAHTDKLRALGEMAAGVSHDLKNIFCPLLLQAETIQRKAERDPKAVLRCVERMKLVLQRGLERVEKLRDFSRQAPERAEVSIANLDDLILDAIQLCTMRFYGAKHKVVIVQQPGDPPPVAVEANELVSVLSNLLVNAAEAMPKGGTVTLATGTSSFGPWARVTDTGPGIPPEIQRHIFEPFFTTKGAQGTGLGLSMAYAFMQRHRGQLTVTSSSQGASFLLQFPFSAANQ